MPCLALLTTWTHLVVEIPKHYCSCLTVQVGGSLLFIPASRPQHLPHHTQGGAACSSRVNPLFLHPQPESALAGTTPTPGHCSLHRDAMAPVFPCRQKPVDVMTRDRATSGAAWATSRGFMWGQGMNTPRGQDKHCWGRICWHHTQIPHRMVPSHCSPGPAEGISPW